MCSLFYTTLYVQVVIKFFDLNAQTSWAPYSEAPNFVQQRETQCRSGGRERSWALHLLEAL